MRIVHVIALVGMLLLPRTALAQPMDNVEPLPEPALERHRPLRFVHRNVEDGLSQATGRAILQDRHGIMWFGGEDGLNRYDGYEFKAFQHVPFDSMSLSADTIWDLHEDDDGTIWIAMATGLDRMNPDLEMFEHFRHTPSDSSTLSPGTARAVLRDRAGALWVGTTQGLNRMDPNRPGGFTRYHHVSGDTSSLSSDDVLGLDEDKSGTLWVSTANGLNRMLAENVFATFFVTSKEDPPRVGQPSSIFYDVVEDPSYPGLIWAASKDGLVRLDSKTGEHLRFDLAPDSPDYGRVFEICFDPSDSAVLWAAMGEEGIVRFDSRLALTTAHRHNPGDPTYSHDPENDRSLSP